MAEIKYEDIDLFYYHSIDFDSSRFNSILDNGIVSKNKAKELGLKYYYRNYTHSSTRDDHISVNTFARTVLRYCQIENELYDYNTNKICFVIDGYINTCDKVSCNNRDEYTKEQHVKDIITTDQIKGILIRDCDSNKRLRDISLNIKFTDKSYFKSKIFTILSFYKSYFNDYSIPSKIYFLIGKYEELVLNNEDTTVIMESISRELQNSIADTLDRVLNKENSTLLDAIVFFNQGRYPLYIMNRFDIKPVGIELNQTDERLEKFRSRVDLPVSYFKKQKSLDKKEAKLRKQMTGSGVNILFGYEIGPLTEKDQEIVEKINKLRLENKTNL